MEMHLDSAVRQSTTTSRRGNRVRVADIAQFDHLIKEHELLTGQRGRLFYLGLHHARPHRVSLTVHGYEVCSAVANGPSPNTDLVQRDAVEKQLALPGLFTVVSES